MPQSGGFSSIPRIDDRLDVFCGIEQASVLRCPAPNSPGVTLFRRAGIIRPAPHVENDLRQSTVASVRQQIPYLTIQSAHFATASLPHGIIGTEEVEFFGDPSMIRSL